jgi:general secretion pathway protein G
MKPRHAAALALAIVLVIVVGIRTERARARYTKAHAQIAALQESLKRYHADKGYYPTTDEGLSALGDYYSDDSDGLWSAPTIDPGILYSRRPPTGPNPIDPWGTPYFYQSDGNEYELKSFGPNGSLQNSEDKALVARSLR